MLRDRHRTRRRSSDETREETNGEHLLVDDANKYKKFRTRTLSTVWMIGGFIFILYLGHLFIWGMIVVIQILMAKELFALAARAQREKQLPGFRLLNWHFFFTAMVYVYGRFLSKQLVNSISSDRILTQLFSGYIKYHMLICYSMYIIGFVWFILTLRKRSYHYQFGQFAWTHMILFVVFTQSAFTVANIFEGIIWFLLPASLIVINDIAAYICGFFFGRTPLIKLSPKKTWEGFIGASIVTVVSASLLANLMGRSLWLTCPRKDLSIGPLYCDPGPLFKPKTYELPSWVITDNGSNCVSMGRLLEAEFPKIVWTQCASHSLDLLMEDIAKLDWVSRIFQCAKSMVKFVTKRPKVCSIFRAHSDLELLSPSTTRFAYMYIVLERLLRVRLGLMRTVVSREWSDLHDIGTPKFISFSRMVMDDSWWTEADIFIKSIKPIYSVLRLTDMEGSTIGLLYEFMDRIGESFQKNTILSSDRLEQLRSIWNRRWDWFHRPIHALAHALHPLWRSEEQESNEELVRNTSDFFSRWANDDLSMIRKLEDELLLFREHSLSFGGPTARLRETQLEPVSWWQKYGTSAPTLRRLAIRVLSQDCSSSPCERNWSTWALFHTKKRNRLSMAQLERLVFCHCNLRLLEQISTFPQPRQVHADSIDIDQMTDIPSIPSEELDIYTMLHLEMMAPAHRTRGASGRMRSGATTRRHIPEVGTSRDVAELHDDDLVFDSTSSSSSSTSIGSYSDASDADDIADVTS